MDLHVEQLCPVDRSVVWWALTDPEALGCWYGELDGFRAEPGCTFVVGQPGSQRRPDASPGAAAPQPVQRGEVLLADAPERLTWRLQRERPLTTVCWRLFDHPQGTVLRLDHTGFSGRAGVVEAALERVRWQRRLRGDLAHLVVEQSAA